MTVLLQVSDPHFGTKRPEVVDALERFVHELRPGVLLLSGDITQRATAAQFAQRALLLIGSLCPLCWPFLATTTLRCST